MKAIVIGGGIGGLTAAAALKGKGWTVRVLERAPTLEPVGSGLAMMPNALRALDTLGVGDRVRALATFAGDGGVRRPDGGWLNRTSAEAAAARFGDPTVVMPRSVLVDLLRALLDPADVRLGVTVESASPDGTVATAAGEERADLVVAADGIGSRVRSSLFPGHPGPRYTGLTAWRLLAADPDRTGAFSETWGRGLVFGVNPIADGRVYCYATAPAPAGTTAPDERRELLRHFGSWHDPIPELLDRADPAGILRNDIYFMPRPLPAFHRDRLVLLGDAAHPMTPNLGQGACQAIEDAVTLAEAVTSGGGTAAYTAARLDRTTKIMAMSHRVSRLTRPVNPLATAVRDAGMWTVGRLGPDLVLRQAAAAIDWRPPA
ncbi:FAD-dependent monooxygenase [Actinomadura algeriensis]|uniref:2-polyprenyl-6-methoxyphenol hydroxylase-like FAD-dependent oxidoreductase n=1 Tax=Actinomadura algeriensis TaxID=1679523 RepID=A0ABR9JPE7_9ACTN|nr:FAD-dependent monooxygenase [Actinomadura algeriensis]MBE1532444.1 2-polyprenyl-6-methoxyphenol hydroxylase-like FAD-dependent oxidoreductase [Actinomadura algeriensis]